MKGGYMKKRGLSAVITTLIIILLVLVAVGGIWIVVNNFIQQGTETIGLSQKCLSVELVALSVIPVSGVGYDVAINRKAGGDAIGGVKVNLFNSTGDNSGVVDFGTVIGKLETEKRTIETGINAGNAGLVNANRLEYTAYFLGDSGEEQLCSGTNEFDF